MDIFTIKKQKYVVNGETYSDIDEMPPELQKKFQDENNNNIPDIFENLTKNSAGRSVRLIDINGKKYTSWDEVPSEFRKYEEVVKQHYSKKDKMIQKKNNKFRLKELNNISLIIIFFVTFILVALSVYALFIFI
ncbi:hypothetical protein GF362_01095 [Candidatus Dojkabacteria bacterium]|nr:hypothetical protein [Candidatus Dojkabacteria bacterium]